MSRLLIAAIATTAIFTGVSMADNHDPIKVRQGMMKKVGGAMKTLAGMAQGKKPYDADAAMEAFTTMHDVSLEYGDYFPEGSDDGDTAAAPAIWTDRDGFEAKLADFQTDTTYAMNSNIATLEAFKPVFGEVAGNCKACHSDYKLDKD